jgi:hypothetical protein
MTSLRMEGKGKGPKGKGSPAFGRAENLSVWALTRRPPQQKDLEVTIQKEQLGLGASGWNVCWSMW